MIPCSVLKKSAYTSGNLTAARFISRKIKFQGNLAAVAIAVSFFVIIVAVAVTSGFRSAIRDGVAAMAGDIRIAPYVQSNGDPVSMPIVLPADSAIRALPGVKSVTPVAIRPGIVKAGSTIHGVVVKGIPDQPSAGVSIPERLAAITGLGVGDKLTTYFIGESVRVRRFDIIAIHRDLLEMDDNLLVYASLADIQRLNSWPPDQVSCLDVRLSDAWRSRSQMDQVAGQISFLAQDFYVSSSARSYPQVFDWLELLDMNVLIILVLMTVVAGFNMVSGLLIMLLRNISTIGILKSMGMDNAGIGRLFVRIGARASFRGMLAGNLLAFLFCLIQGKYHLIPLDPANYFVSWVPIHLSLPRILLADLCAFAAILALLWLPSLLISRIDPAKTVKAE